MPRFAAHCSMLFVEQPFLDRFERAAKAGFGAAESRDGVLRALEFRAAMRAAQS